MGIHRTVKKKIQLTKLSKKIQRLVKLHGKVKLEVYNTGRYNSNNMYGVRYLKENGDCHIHYTNDDGYNDSGRQTCCFFDDYSTYSNDNGDQIIVKSLNDTLRAMQYHDRGSYKIKHIYVGKRKIKV